VTQTSSPPRAARRALRLIVAAVTLGGMALAVPAFLSAASAATETPLSQTGWVATANTSSSAGDAPQNAISGDTGARFSSDAAQASGMYWQVNMGSAQTFNQIEMDSGGYSTDYARGYNVEVSTNGSTFTSVATGTGASSPETVTFATQTAQYIRVVLTQAASPSWWSMVNFTVYTSAGGSGGNTVTETNPGRQTGTVGTAASLQISASDSASGQTLSYSAAGLPAGLSINASTGLISGTPTTAGTSSVTVTAKDTTGASGTASFSWTENAASSGGGGTSGQLSETGWVASSNTSSSAGDAPQNAINGSGGRFSSDADEAPGMYWQVNMGSKQTFNQVVLASGGNAGDYANGYDVEVSNDGVNFTPVYFSTSTGQTETATFSPQTAQYIRILLTASSASDWWSMTSVTVDNTPVTPPTASAPATGGSLGSNVTVFTPSESVSSILSTLNTISNAQVGNQFGAQRYQIYFEPGSYGTSANPLVFTVGYYEAIAGLGQLPSGVVINGAINTYNQCSGTTCNATDNFWRSVTNLTINVTGMTGCFAGDDVWAASQASPMRDVVINGNVTLMDFCDGSPDYASGGFIANSDITGAVTNGSQQQYYTRNTDIGSWSNAVWNQVFSGDPGAPAQSFAANSGDSGGPNSYTTLSSTPQSEEEPFLYTNSAGAYEVFAPSPQTNSDGPNFSSGTEPGSSLPLSDFYVVNSSSTVAQINAALAAGDDLLFTPGVYSYASTINVTNPNTKIIGLGFATLIPTAGNITLSTADVPGINISGLIFDAGPTQSSSLLQIGTEGSTANNAANPVSVDDVFFRVGGAEAGTVATAFVDNSNNSIIDDSWIWRADHGAGAGGWTGDQSATGLVVNGSNVETTGLAVEHFQQYETIWNGQGGTDIFFQNENPYEVPSQAVWMSSATQDGYPAFYLPSSVTSFTGYGMGSYSYFDQGVSIENATGFQAPVASGIHLNDLFTVFLNGSGGIESVVNGTGAAVSPTNGGPSDVVSAS
jgi:F5/8 type C domain/Putative Ig domain